MPSIVPFLKEVSAAFDFAEIQAMSLAFDDVCNMLKLSSNQIAREIVAIRIIELAQRGETNPTRLRQRLLEDANSGSGC